MKILLANDGSKHSEPAIQTIGNFKLSSGDEVKIISVVDLAVPLAIDLYPGYLPTTLEIEKSAQEHAGRILDETAQKVKEIIGDPNVIISTETLVGSPESKIVEAAEEMRADLIVVGSHGYNRWERLLLGSVSDSVVHHAPCSVLIVRSTFIKAEDRK